jgi:hypothetical protein
MAKGSIKRRGASWTVVVDVGRDSTTAKRKQLSKGAGSLLRGRERVPVPGCALLGMLTCQGQPLLHRI